MTKFLLPCFLLLSTVTFGQTSYTSFEDAKRLIKWYKLPDTEQVKKDSAKAMLTLLLYYSKNNNNKLSDSVNNIFLDELYRKVNNVYSFNVREKLTIDAVTARVLEFPIVPSTLQPIKKDFIQFRQLYEGIKTRLATLKLLKPASVDSAIVDSAQNIIAFLKSNPTVKDFVPASADDFVVNIHDSLGSFTNTFTSLANQIDEGLNQELNRRKKEMFDAVKIVSERDLLNLFPEFKLDGQGSVKKAMNEFEGSFQTQTEAAIVKIQVDKQHENTIASSNLVDLNFPNQSDVIDAVAIYLAKRTKQEAALFFLETLVTVLRTNPLAQDLFPNTWKVMQAMESYTTPRFGAQWRNAIANDFIELPQNIKSSAYIASKVPNRVLFEHFSDAVTFAGYVGKKYSFPDVVRTLYNDHSLLQGKWTNIAVDALYIINNELRDVKSKNFSWIKPESFLKQDSLEAFCFFDLLRLQYQDEVSGPMQSLLGNTKTIRARLPEYLRFFSEVLTVLKQFNTVQADAAEKTKDGTVVAPDGFWDTQRNLLDFLLNQKLIQLEPKERQAINLCKSSFFVYDHLSNKNYIGATEHVIGIVSELLGNNTAELIHLQPKAVALLRKENTPLYQAVNTLNQRFSDLGVLQQLERYIDRPDFSVLPPQNLRDSFELKDRALYRQLISKGSFDKSQLTPIMETLKDSLVKNYNSLRQILNKMDKKEVTYVFKKAEKLDENMLNTTFLISSRENSKYFKWLADFAGLLTEISVTKKADELANIIESYALPPGSYRMKRNADFSIDLNAFTGFYVGAEYIKKLDQTGFVYGLTAPIGLAFSWGSTDDKVSEADRESDLTVTKKGILRRRTQNSFTLDLTLVDLGAVVSYRFSGGAEGLPNKPRWDQVISVGANARWGIKKTPFCIGLGFMQTPKLRTIDKEQERAYRAQLSFTFDLPLVNVYRRS